MIAALLFVFAQAAATPGGGAPPVECAPLGSATASNVWERAKSPALRRYCDLLASGAAKMAGGGNDDVREALAIADEAGRTLPGRAGPGVLRGRALARLGRWHEAQAALEEARALDPHALDDPAALLAWARTLARAGHRDEAEAAYRALLPRASSLSPAERGKAEVEAGLLAEGRGAAGLDEAIAVLRQARRDAQDTLQSIAAYALALALDRAGEREESRVVLGGEARKDAHALVQDARTQEALADAAASAEGDALEALAFEVSDPSQARASWAKYLAGPGGKGPWGDHARAHEAGGRSRGGR